MGRGDDFPLPHRKKGLDVYALAGVPGKTISGPR